MINLIIIMFYLVVGIFSGTQAYKASSLEDKRDLVCIIAIVLGSVMWPIVIIIIGIHKQYKKN